MPDAHSVIIVGAGPSGAVSAILLARAGWRVTLLEQHRFPRDKVCGECLSATGIDVLRRIGLDSLIRSYGAIPLHFTHLHAADGTSATVALPRPMWGISRHVLDQLLLIEAGRSGTEVRQPARCESLVTTGPTPTIRVRDLLTNVVTEERPDWVIVADGKSALLGAEVPRPTKDFGLKVHFKDIAGPADAIELFGTMDTYGGLAPIENNRWNAAFSVPASLLRLHAGDLEMVWERLVGENKTLRKRLADATRVSPFLASPLPRFGVRRQWPNRVIPVGNAAAAMEPIGGEGMGLALRSAELAVEHLLSAQNGTSTARDPGGTAAASSDPSNPDITSLDPVELQNAYHHLWRTRRTACRAAAKVVSSGVFSGMAMEFLRHNERVGQRAMAWMGK
ncbi:NAD(P)/FAD-dependent oxidoreductase [Humisphaera borealis]|uniref:FAD-dependent monooxygenase n=1 Tax=Humisphaera borealis TaxID=2807512 RepID=A0A7M2WW50_9BACT|nr:NAD(P)/FAD-dependent oxidoreductase [Humisphaera borealis]QOV89633.1 FAD-dependent monooxygenase [Humisphaera borealis]